MKHFGGSLFAAWFITLSPAITAIAASPDVTRVAVSIPDRKDAIDPMIYGQMFEHVDSPMIYGGVVNKDGSERPHVTALMKELQIPVIRWPGGTVVHEYDWKRGIGPLDKRPAIPTRQWNEVENHRFGTDEFIKFCKKVGSEPYINFNMSNTYHPTNRLKDAMEWIEYVNGPADSEWGARRAGNGHPEPYGVKYWGIGNENWGGFGIHRKETAEEYAVRLKRWASTIRKSYPELELLGVGWGMDWDRTVLATAGPYIDFLKEHVYVTSSIVDGKLAHPERTLFAPVKIEAFFRELCPLVEETNSKLERTKRPIRISVDEWNNRHHFVIKGKRHFSRMDDRRPFDAAVAANVLNVFIRHSPTIGMATYIFPVDSHGLIRTVGDKDAFKTPLYYVFQQYRRWMLGNRLDVRLSGPGRDMNFNFALDCPPGIRPLKGEVPFVDAAAALNSGGELTVAVVNRSHDTTLPVELSLPSGYVPEERWLLAHDDINARNTASRRDTVAPSMERNDSRSFMLPPCGVCLVRCRIAR